MITRELVAQDESRRLIEETLSPWPVTRWEANDFGIDAVVEIASAIPDSAHHRATGKLFAVQLKATDQEHERTTLRVSTVHLSYWLNHSLPVLLVSAHLPTQTMRSRWIDETLRDELLARTPTLWGHETVTVNLDAVPLTTSRRDAIENHVFRFRQRRLTITPSRFLHLRREVEAAADRLETFAKESGVETVNLLVTDTRKVLRASAYTVVVAGPQRVGKSTLVNALLGVDVSPVADYPTTAVPIAFEPGDKALASVVLADGRTLDVEATSAALRPYAAQQENDGNEKQVKAIRVVLPNEMLSRGISLIDAPGLHDASEGVRYVTERAIEHADAVLFVLDGGLGAKFKLGKAEVDDLRVLQSSKDRLLIVLNQADLLESAQVEPLRAYVERELRKHGVWDALPVPPVFVSGRNAWRARSAHEIPPDDFAKLEDELWGHLLRHRITGFHRLGHAVAQLCRACDDASGLLFSQADRGREASQLAAARAACAKATDSTLRELTARRTTIIEDVVRYLEANMGARINALQAELAALPENSELPTKEAVEQRLVSELTSDTNAVLQHLRKELGDVVRATALAVRKALDDTRARLGIPQPSGFVDIAVNIAGVDLSLPEAHAGFIGGLLGFLIHPALGFLTTFVGLLFGHGIGVARRRERVLKELADRYGKGLHTAYEKLARQTQKQVSRSIDILAVQVRARLETFMNDAERATARLGTKPLSDAEVDRLRALAERLKEHRPALDRIAAELSQLTG